MMVSFSVKPGDQIDEIESPNLVNKTELKGESKLFLFLALKLFPNSTNRPGVVKGNINKKLLSHLADSGH